MCESVRISYGDHVNRAVRDLTRHTRRELLVERLAAGQDNRVSALASELGVSAMTIRRDLDDLQKAGVVERHHGGASLAAGALRRRHRRYTLAFIAPMHVYYYGAVRRGAVAAAEQLGARLIHAASGYEEDREQHYLDRIDRLDIDGLVVTPGQRSGEPSVEFREWLSATKLPVVIMERTIAAGVLDPPRDSVSSDHAQGSVLALRHLMDLGHRRITFAATTTATTPALTEGVRLARRELAGLELDHHPGLSALDPGGPGDPIPALLDAAAGHRSTAFFVHSDQVGRALVTELVRRGISVPGQVSV
ncbi:MAG TPA: DeoR family transcriptional regulator, partial [Candidatus Avipropionibacterium avicola]|nr:DeoR family transcriptional regulator [Candidatus Avipropionibacterium avicola]